MNTYQDNLRTTVKTTLETIELEQEKHASGQQTADYNRYSAIGNEQRATAKNLQADKAHKTIFGINEQGVKCGRRSNNVLQSATSAETNTAATATNTATAAQNAQVAANAVLKMSAAIGSANNIVNASNYGSNIQSIASDTNDIVSRTAFLAEKVSLISMQSTTEAAQIIARQVLAEVTKTNSEFEAMQQATTAQLATATEIRAKTAETLITTETALEDTNGLLDVANKELVASTGSYETANENLNLGLQANNFAFVQHFPKWNRTFNPQETSGTTISLYFSPVIQGKADGNHLGDGTQYYLAVCKKSERSVINNNQAQQLFAADINGTRFVQAKPEEWQTVHLINTGSLGLAKGDLTLTHDINDDPVVSGVPYVAYIYVKASNQLKAETGDFDDQISVSSQQFTLAQTLKGITDATSQNPSVNATSGESAAPTVLHSFTFPAPSNNPENVNYRCILVPDCGDGSGLEGSNPCAPGGWFDPHLAGHVPEVDYTLATSPDKGKTFSYSITDMTFDNFGALFDAGSSYYVFIYSIVPAGTFDASGDDISLSFNPRLQPLCHYNGTTGAITIKTPSTSDTAPSKAKSVATKKTDTDKPTDKK